MGTRADFYVGRGVKARWIGSIAFDGYPTGIPISLRKAKTAREFRKQVSLLSEREDFTSPEQGWPWPWNDSLITDYAYAFEKGKVWASCFGAKWFDPLRKQPEPKEDEKKVAIFPNMESVKSFTLGKRSGLVVFTYPK